MISTYLFVLLYLISPDAIACSPVAGLKAPTLIENFEQAQRVFFGIVEEKTPSDGVFKLQIKIESVWKGQKEKRIEAITRPTSTCDTFGLVDVGGGCIFFLSSNNKIVSGVTTGDSSFCIPGNASRMKTLVNEYDHKFGKVGK